ncbi:MAG TPA: DUF3794 domain-containing protein [Candidatus Caccousia avicola]|uniref:DUF3794 domain-containing protein n=1 Tax=Candidatus Caccousia avicola TaxID=2840721 RepID=A0A9D1ARF2_9FIRM|nr:DUF3794 domain-containing protein [Candidatus Caccousia avicola]
MDYTAQRNPLSVIELLYDGCQEQSVDLDISLPDYCPDIQKILKCQVYPRILDRTLAGDHIEISGTYTVKILYLDAVNGTIRCCENGSPFSCTIPMKKNIERGKIKAFARVEYINCRAASSRRLDVHGSFSICVKVYGSADCEAVCSIVGDDIEQRTLEIPFSRMSAFCVQNFHVEEVLELPGTKPEAETLLHSSAVVNMQDYKVIQNKLMVKGDVTLHLLYASPSEEYSLETMEYAIPFTQMLDCDGIEEEDRSDVRLSVIGTDVQIKNDYSGGKVFFDAQIRLCADITAFQNKQTTIVSDAYSRSYEMALEYQQKNAEELTEIFGDSMMKKISFPMEQEVSKVIDVWSELCSVSPSKEENGLTLDGKFSICMLAVSSDGKPFYFERLADFQHKRPFAGDGELRCDADASIAGLSYRITGNELEIKAEISVSGSVFSRRSCRMVEAAHADETKPRERDRSAALILYYAEAGEALWDIARLYCTSMEAIQRENGLECEKMDSKGMLLIPMQAN